jgi:hypothetical protein
MKIDLPARHGEDLVEKDAPRLAAGKPADD